MAVTKKQSKQAASENTSSVKKGNKDNSKKATAKDNKKNVQAKNRKNKLSTLKSHLMGVWNELKKVHWPNRKETLIYTSVVVVTVVVVSAMLWVFDLILSTILRFIY